MDGSFDGLGLHLGTLARVSNAQSRSISAENPTGGKGQGGLASEGTCAEAARELGRGWKVSPSIPLEPESTVVLADIDGPGAIQHFWITPFPPLALLRRLILRIYWDDEPQPSVEVPLGDLFCNGWCHHCDVNSLPVVVNPSRSFNSYWEMPFRRHARITLENTSPRRIDEVYYQIDYTLTDVPQDRAYFHAQWRRSNPLQRLQVHTLLDGVRGRGHYVGTYIAWGSNSNGWWGEGEVKFFLDGDTDGATICGTGTEDYFGGAWCFAGPDGEYQTYSTPFSGFHQVIQPHGTFQSQTRFGMYRWHVMDPIRFKEDLRVTVQALGYMSTVGEPARFIPLQDDVASTAFWYQIDPHAP
ncbi:MAG: DUF2961 domain-containing protein, partial [Anaerolineae bacterium]|nr:DUF2961 domain-containing protein [Anaerolineae bacterium]